MLQTMILLPGVRWPMVGVAVVGGTSSELGGGRPPFARRDVVGSNPTTLNNLYYHGGG